MPDPQATTVAECIDFTPGYVANVAYVLDENLHTQFSAWIAGLFGPSGIYADGGSSTQRMIVNWYAQHVIALSEFEGTGTGEAGPIAVAGTINAVVRVLYSIDSLATNAQKTAVVALFNSSFAITP